MPEESFWGNPRTWVGVAFVIFFVLFGRKIWSALASMLDARADAIRAELAEATRLRTEAEHMLHDARARREAAERDAKDLLERAALQARQVAQELAAEAQAAGRRREKMAMDRIAAAEKAALDDVRLAAADVATQAARRILAETLTGSADAVLIDRAIAQLPAALGSRRAA